MGSDFAETSVNKIDVKKFEKNYNNIDWSGVNKEDVKLVDVDNTEECDVDGVVSLSVYNEEIKKRDDEIKRLTALCEVYAKDLGINT